MSNVPTGALELCFLSGNPSSLPTMLGGSASSQASGAPFRNDSDSRASAWPPTAHQTDLYSRGYGIYSLFPGLGENGKGLYAPAVKATRPVNHLQTFIETQKVSDAFFSTKFTFGSNGGSDFELGPNATTRGHSDATTRLIGQNGKVQVSSEGHFSVETESKSKKLFSNPDLTNTIADEIRSSGLSGDMVDENGDYEGDIRDGADEKRSKPGKNGIPHGLVDDNAVTTCQGRKFNEPDSTEFRIVQDQLGNKGLAGYEVDYSDKNVIDSGNERGFIKGTDVKACFDRNGKSNGYLSKGTCSLIDPSGDCDGKSNDLGKTDLAEKIYQDAKTADSSCKILTINCRQFSSETSKSSPNRMLCVSPNNGGCSRTTPVTFKHLTKPQNGNGEMAPVSIKKEPVDFHKYPNGSPYLGFTPLENLFNPALRVFESNVVNAVPYSDSYESYSRGKGTFPSPGSDRTGCWTSGQTFLSPRPISSEAPFLSPNLDLGEFRKLKSYQKLTKDCSTNLASSTEMLEGVRGCLSNVDIGQVRDGTTQVNSTTAESDKKFASSGKTSESVNVTPCQVAEVTSASALLSPKLQGGNSVAVKQEAVSGSSISCDKEKEVTPIPSGQSTAVSSTVGISPTKHGCQSRQEEVKMSLNADSPPSAHPTVQASSINVSPALGAAVYPGGFVHNDRPTGIWPAPPHNPGLWQYSASIDYPPFPPVGFQLVRDPITGHFLLIPASNLEALQRAILWPSYEPTTSQMIIPSLSLHTSPPRLLLDSNMPTVDYLTPEAIQRQAPHHRILITTEPTNSRKIMGPALIKLEASESNNAVSVSALESDVMYSKTTTLSSNENIDSFSRVSLDSTHKVKSRETSSVPCLIPEQLQSIGSTELSNETYKTGQLFDLNEQTQASAETIENEGSQIPVGPRNKFEVLTNTAETESDKRKMDLPLTGEPEEDKRAVLREIQKRREMEQSLRMKILNVPDVNIKKEIISPLQVDLSGLELLSNSIDQLMCESKPKAIAINCAEKHIMDVDRKDMSNDACEGAVLLQNLKNGFREVDSDKTLGGRGDMKNLGGLGLLCALAEQRFQEEIENFNNEKKQSNFGDETDEEKENVEEFENRHMTGNEKNVVQNNHTSESESSCMKQDVKDCDFNRNYHSDYEYLSTVKEENHKDTETNVSGTEILNSFEELENVSDEESKNRTKKINSKKLFRQLPSRKSKEMSPPVLEKQTDYAYSAEHGNDNSGSQESKVNMDGLKPPTLTPNAILEPLERSAPEIDRTAPHGIKKINEKVNRNVVQTTGGDADFSEMSEQAKKRKLSDSIDQNFSSLAKKRKVGRPKKRSTCNGNCNSTETIVTKKSKAKSIYQFHSCQADDVSDAKYLTTKKCNNAFENTNDEIFNVINEDDKRCKTKKIRPKLKAEPKIRESTPASDEMNLIDWNKNEKEKKEEDGENISRKVELPKKQVNCKKRTEDKSLDRRKHQKYQSCVLTVNHIKADSLPKRTLTEMGGLFYAGQLNAIRAPDVYGVTIDGERGHRPHIYSREEILKYSILEVKPTAVSDLLPGTRCCAYWSEQYRCLYPGTVSVPASSDSEPDDRFVNVEFDDGDSGKINIEDIRLLPEGYPPQEYDPNPLQSLSKRRRRISVISAETHSKEKKCVEFSVNSEKVDNEQPSAAVNNETDIENISEGGDIMSFLGLDANARHLKKKRREKLKRLQSLSIEGKRKHKKHRCSDEHRHHKHHKKHKKHRHKHGIRRDGDGGGDKNELDGNGKVERQKVKKIKKSGRKQSEKRPIGKSKKCKKRTDSVESRSKIAAFLPARQLWGWSGKGFKRPGAKGRARKEFYKAIQRGKERIMVGDCAVFLSTGRPDRPYIGRIESMWESWGTNMIVKVKWFYHPEETVGCPATLEYPGGLFESPHVDENDVQTISHKCEVLPLKEYTEKLGNSPHRYETIYDNNDIHYLAGYYDPTNTTLRMEPGVK